MTTRQLSRGATAWLLTIVSALMAVLPSTASVAYTPPPLAGFYYGTARQPEGHEWESPDSLAYNKLQPTAWVFAFQSPATASKVLPQYSAYYQSLDGAWKFHHVTNPQDRPKAFYALDFNDSSWDTIQVPSCWNVAGIQPNGTLKYGTPIYCNQPVIFAHQVAVGDWRGGVMRTPPQDWTTYNHRNEVGSYRRTFTFPKEWSGKRIHLHLDGVNSFFYLWVNGKYVGFSKNSRNTASFDITPYLQSGENLLAAEVYRNSDGSFLEAQDMFRLPGIFRSVYLTARSPLGIQDLRIVPHPHAGYQEKKLQVSVELRTPQKSKNNNLAVRLLLYPNKLYTSTPAATAVYSHTYPLEKGSDTQTLTLQYPNAELWSAEAPYTYALVAELLNSRGEVLETVSALTAFRKVEILDTPASEDEFGLAGRYYYINGKPVKLKGVNRQEISPLTGNTITEEQIRQEILLMKQNNINHVRCSHYSNTPIWYHWCSIYGIYLEDEANLESHQYYYGKASLSHVPEFRKAHVARVMEMARARVNSPAVVIWSLGNEAGPGDNFKEAYQQLHNFDPSRPVQYERNNDIVDMGSNQYPSIRWTREAVKGNYPIKYPFHISEYAHSMGNAGGNLKDYWDAIESTNYFCGAAIWDWVDQALLYYSPNNHTPYFAYGGDFGDKPNSGMFCMNGVLFPNHTPKPVLAEVKQVYQNMDCRWNTPSHSQIRLFNKRYFTALTDLDIHVSLLQDGEVIQHKNLGVAQVEPRKAVVLDNPFASYPLDTQYTYHLRVELKQRNKTPWSEAGYVQMAQQLPLQTPNREQYPLPAKKHPSLQLVTSPNTYTVKGEGFSVEFNRASGTIHQFVHQGEALLTPGKGPQISAFRAPVDNDNWAYTQWIRAGLHALQQKATAESVQQLPNGAYRIYFSVTSKAPHSYKVQGGSSGHYKIEETNAPQNFFIKGELSWVVYPDATIELQSALQGSDPSLPLARIGFEMMPDSTLQQVTYFGNGPENNYPDRLSGSFVAKYQTTVANMFVPFPKPQSCGNREGVHYCALRDKEGKGLLFVSNGTKPMSFSALPWSALEMMLAPHTYELPASGQIHLHLDAKVTGLGGNSCGQGPPLPEHRVMATGYNFSFLMRPLKKHDKASALAKVRTQTPSHLLVSRDVRGVVTIQSQTPKGRTIVYNIGGKQYNYTAPFLYTEAGTLTASYNDGSMPTTIQLERLERIPVTILDASGSETGEGNPEHLVDGNPNTIWHSAYSVTVARYPHWVAFDAGEPISMKGINYLPRQDASNNGVIDAYKIMVSNDAKTWTPLLSGRFAKGKQRQQILFPKPVKARYLRLDALSSQGGEDFASAAEIELLRQ